MRKVQTMSYVKKWRSALHLIAKNANMKPSRPTLLGLWSNFTGWHLFFFASAAASIRSTHPPQTTGNTVYGFHQTFSNEEVWLMGQFTNRSHAFFSSCFHIHTTYGHRRIFRCPIYVQNVPLLHLIDLRTRTNHWQLFETKEGNEREKKKTKTTISQNGNSSLNNL